MLLYRIEIRVLEVMPRPHGELLMLLYRIEMKKLEREIGVELAINATI